MKLHSPTATIFSKVQTFVCAALQFSGLFVGASSKSSALISGARDERMPHTVTIRLAPLYQRSNSAIMTEVKAIVDGNRGRALRLLIVKLEGHAS
jgi:hypothetical protein